MLIEVVKMSMLPSKGLLLSKNVHVSLKSDLLIGEQSHLVGAEFTYKCIPVHLSVPKPITLWKLSSGFKSKLNLVSVQCELCVHLAWTLN